MAVFASFVLPFIISGHLYILAKASHLAHLRFAEYAMLIAASDVTGHYGVGVLLESVLADKLALLSEIDASFDTSSKARSPNDWQLDSGCDHWQRPAGILESRRGRQHVSELSPF